MVGTILAFTLYLGVMIFIGFYVSKKNSSAEDFFLGGRQMGPWVTALSAEASDMSAYLLMGLPGLAYLTGMNEVFWTALGLLVGTYLNWLFIAKPLRKISKKLNAITIPEFFENRFQDDKHIIKTIASLVILFFFVIYTASAFLSCGKLFVSVFGIKYGLALVIGVAVILTYTLLGGFKAVAITDLWQGILMFISIVMTAFICYFICVKNKGIQNSLLNMNLDETFTNPIKGAKNFGIINIISSLSWGIGYFGMPHILVRFMSISNPNDIKLSRRIAIVWLVLAMGAALFMGIVGKVYLMNNGILLDDPENVFAVTLKNVFPSFIAGIFLCGILASSMSTADSQLLVASSAFSVDIYKAHINKNADETLLFKLSKLSVVVIALIASVLALNKNSSIFNVVSYAWAGFGASFAPVVFGSLFFKKATKNAAIASMITGSLVVIIWKNLKGGIFDIYELLPAFIIAMTTMIVVSLLDKNNNKKSEEFYSNLIAD